MVIPADPLSMSICHLRMYSQCRHVQNNLKSETNIVYTKVRKARDNNQNFPGSVRNRVMLKRPAANDEKMTKVLTIDMKSIYYAEWLIIRIENTRKFLVVAFIKKKYGVLLEIL